MANPYHDSLGRFCSREGQLANINRAIKSGNVNLYLAERRALEEVDQLNQFNPKDQDKNLGVPAALQFKEVDLAEQTRVLNNGTKEEVEYFISERTNRPEYLDLLKQRDDLRAKSELLNNEYKILAKAFDAHQLDDFDEARDKGLKALHAYEDLQSVKSYIADYKDITAPVVAQLSDIIAAEEIENGTYREYTEQTLNNLETLGEYESGSREWLESRQNGIGGSDVGRILGVDKMHGGPKDREIIILSKLNEITDEEVEAQALGHSAYAGAAGRGNAWEEYILHRISNEHPELNITHCKASWKNTKAPFQYANFDGLMTDENGQPNGIIEIKTASDPTKWGDPKDGLAAIPPNYKAQALWYTHAAGFDRGMVAVMIDDNEYREYPFTMTPELKAEAQKSFETIRDTFIPELEARRDGTWTQTRRQEIRKGFTKTLVEDIRKGSADADVFKEISVYREESPIKTKARFDRICKDPSDEQEIRSSLRQLFTEKNPSTRKQNFVGIDIETSGTTATRGRVIEVGLAIKRPKDEQIENTNQRYGLPKRAEAVGTGWVEGHGITMGSIAKQRNFLNPESQAETLEQLKDGIMVAHNASYERAFFRLHLKGFAEAERAGQIKILDTMKLTQYLLPDTKNNTLQELSNKYGIEYINAHRAGNDARFMTEALVELEKELYKEHKVNAKAQKAA